MLVRFGTIHDSKTISDFQLSMALETECLKLKEETVLLGVQKILKNADMGQYLVVENENNLIACLLCLPEWSDWRNLKILWIHSVYVVPEFRSRGVYKMMYNYLKHRVEQSNEYGGIRLYVDNKNFLAQEVYKKLGMNGDHYRVFEWMKN